MHFPSFSNSVIIIWQERDGAVALHTPFSPPEYINKCRPETYPDQGKSWMPVEPSGLRWEGALEIIYFFQWSVMPLKTALWREKSDSDLGTLSCPISTITTAAGWLTAGSSLQGCPLLDSYPGERCASLLNFQGGTCHLPSDLKVSGLP